MPLLLYFTGLNATLTGAAELYRLFTYYQNDNCKYFNVLLILSNFYTRFTPNFKSIKIIYRNIQNMLQITLVGIFRPERPWIIVLYSCKYVVKSLGSFVATENLTNLAFGVCLIR